MTGGKAFRTVLIYIAALGAGIGAGIASANWVTQTDRWLGGVVERGPWRTSLLIGTEAADPWTRATVARIGLLALARSEAVYFAASVDSDGNPITADATYAISGSWPASSWWSLTAYNKDNYLFDVDPRHYAVSSEDFSAGRGAIMLGPAVSGASRDEDALRLATRGQGPVYLVLRLYDHPGWDEEDLARLELPSISKLDDAGAADE